MKDLSKLTLRALLTLARERLGPAAAGLKTRDEILAALAPGAPEERDPGEVEVVARDFFVRRT